MTVSVEVLFETPHKEVASRLEALYASSRRCSLVAGFMTVEGIGAISTPMRADPSKLDVLVVGAGTFRAFDAFDRLLAMGVSPATLRVHLGHSRATTGGATHAFYRYHPMLHSKVYLFEMADGTAAAFVGSHNLTGFALYGLNGEAAVLIQGPESAEPIRNVKAHIEAAAAAAVEYDPLSREGYAWWSHEFMAGLADKFRDLPQDGEAKRTLILLAEGPRDPSKDDVIYFEIPEALGKISSLRAEVHVYLFDKLPSSPQIALTQLASARKSLWCKTIGIEDDRGGRELRADWHIDDSRRPVLKAAPRVFRPSPVRGMQQIRVQVYYDVRGRFDYLFGDAKASFEPVYDTEDTIAVPGGRAAELQDLNLIPREDLPWQRVKALRRSDEAEETPYRAALRELSPQSGAYILMSPRRRSRAEAG